MKLLTLLSVVLFANVGWAAETTSPWPRFRGTNGSGIAEDQQPPIEFGPEKNVKWKVAVPDGLSSPIIAGDKIVLTAYEDNKLFTIAYNRADGSEAWRKDAGATKIEPFFPIGGGPASSTPATDGERIVSYFGSCGLRCYDLEGKELWRIEMPTAVTSGNFGSGVSPIIADGMVILVRDEKKDPKILAVDIETGDIKWEQKRRSLTSFATPTVWKTSEGTQIAAAGHGQMVGYDLKSGEEKWTVSTIPSGCCSSPVVFDGKLFFAGSSPGGPDDNEFQLPKFDVLIEQADTNKDGALSREEAQATFIKDFFDNNDSDLDGTITRTEWDTLQESMSQGVNIAFALKAGGMGDITETNTLWKQTKTLPYLASAILYQGQYVMVKDGGIVCAYDAETGKQVYAARSADPGQYYGSPVAANGCIYFVSRDEGVVTVLKAGTTEPEVLAKNPKLGEQVSATPAIADDTLYIRSAKHLYAFSEK